ncbi:hypothetical protein MMC29_003143 [Sticta canariensis]|nr:hypothetical protein [Sticta canariensis]
MSAVRQIWRSLLRKDKSVDKWRSILTDPSSAMLLHQQDKNVNQLQNVLQELSISGRETFASTITLLTTKICVAENEDEFSYIRAVLEVFVLYSITTSDFAWMRDSRAVYIGRQTETMSEITFSPSRVPSPLDAGSSESCLRLAALREKISRRERCRSEIIKMIVELANTMPLDLLFVTYDHESLSHRLNAVKFVKNLNPTGYYWIAMAYCLAIEYRFYDPPPAYVDGLV